jgi:hypothetical protein
MTTVPLPLGMFACRVTLEVIRPPKFARVEEAGVTYLIGRDYELAYRTILRFENLTELPITAKLFGDINRQVVIRDGQGRPAKVSGYVQGRNEIRDSDGNLIFEGHYYDSRVAQALTGDDELTPTGNRIVDHCENGFGRGAAAGHAFSLAVRLTREGNVPGGATALTGDATGQID